MTTPLTYVGPTHSVTIDIPEELREEYYRWMCEDQLEHPEDWAEGYYSGDAND